MLPRDLKANRGVREASGRFFEKKLRKKLLTEHGVVVCCRGSRNVEGPAALRSKSLLRSFYSEKRPLS
jgi:hypothetical protein